MSASEAHPWARTAVLSGLAASLLIVVPAAAASRWPTPPSLALGVGAGSVLFVGLARRAPALRVPDHRRAAFAAKALLLAVRSASEEVIWRWALLGALTATLGPVPALAVATCCFALAHAGWQGRRGVAVHLLTGATFGGVFLVSGSLAAAIGAHVAYNLLVALAVESERAPPWRVAVPPAEVVPARLERASKRFGATLALESVGFAVRAGHVVALLGPNGAGKTTAVALLLGLRRPTSGRALLFGRDPRRPAARRDVGATPQESAFSPTLTVRELVDFVRAHHDRPLETADALERFGLTDLANRQAGGLSGGQRRRLAVALAFAGDPQAVFLDEPTTGLDVASRRAVWDAIRAFAATGRTVLLTTHNLEEAEALATRVVVLARGRVVADTTVCELKARAGVKRLRLAEQPLPRLPG
ncbi:MAG: ATP-binding cassette domain-containing protein, partial [Actinomycetota bacterium]|nr:ATP-binding cassette domain-containing protein [Actinomycetota bacterium]